jgi:aminomethyltransferase
VHPRHASLGAKFAAFGGWQMPLEYAGGGVLAEHAAVRERVGLFDVGHLGKITVTGPGALEHVDRCLTNALGRIPDGRAQYTLCCDEVRGGILDDLIVYRWSTKDLLLVPNAANAARVVRELSSGTPDGVVVVDRHSDLGVLAVQGPLADQVMQALGLPCDLRYMAFAQTGWGGGTVIVCRTGYTGERGFELVPDADLAPDLWDALLTAVVDRGGLPCGLGARDTLRTEMGYPLHGHELSEDITPVEAGLEWAVGWDKPAFRGRRALVGHRERRPGRRARGLLALDRGVLRPDLPVFAHGVSVGTTTSGTFSPTLRRGIALALLDAAVQDGDEAIVRVRGREIRCTVTAPPFIGSRPF